MKKEPKFINSKRVPGGLIVILVIVVLCILVSQERSRFCYTLQDIWGLSIPNTYSEVYSIESELNDTGEVVRYHVFQYKDADNLGAQIAWVEEGVNYLQKSYSEATEEWLDAVEVPKEHHPDYEKSQYFYWKKSNNSELILLWDEEANVLYIMEHYPV